MASHINKISELLLAGPLSQTELAKTLSISQPTVSIIMRDNSALFLQVGKARATRFYLRRTLHGQSEWSVYRITAQGRAEMFATLYSVYPQGFAYLINQDGTWFYSDSLPWWMDDMRPQGFIGRALVNARPIPGLPADLKEFHDEDVLQMLLHCPLDSVGNLLIGDTAYQSWLARQPVASITDQHFLQIAGQAMAGWTGGSSAGGEQPKFLASIDGHSVPCLVKFSAPMADDNRTAHRWADLLRAEHLALDILAGYGVPAAASRIADCQENGVRRVFLCIERFDRTAQDGRRGLVSLRVLDAQFVAKKEQRWPFVAANLVRQGVIREADLPVVSLLYCFGKLIGNTDMHNGNLSFFHDGSLPLELAPVYDMLPMFFSPLSGEIPQGLPQIRIDSDIAGRYWREALPLAMQFWQRLAQEADLQPDFCATAIAMQAMLQEQVGPVIDKMA